MKNSHRMLMEIKILEEIFQFCPFHAFWTDFNVLESIWNPSLFATPSLDWVLLEYAVHLCLFFHNAFCKPVIDLWLIIYTFVAYSNVAVSAVIMVVCLCNRPTTTKVASFFNWFLYFGQITILVQMTRHDELTLFAFRVYMFSHLLWLDHLCTIWTWGVILSNCLFHESVPLNKVFDLYIDTFVRTLLDLLWTGLAKYSTAARRGVKLMVEGGCFANNTLNVFFRNAFEV